MRITVVVADATHAMYAGGEVERVSKTFDAPKEMEDFVNKFKKSDGFVSMSISIEQDNES